MAVDSISIGTDGYFVSDRLAYGAEIFSGGWFYQYISPGSTRAIAKWTDGYFEYTGNDQTAEVIFSFGDFRGYVAPTPPTGGVVSVLRQYMEQMHY